MLSAIGAFVRMFFLGLTKGMSAFYQYMCAVEDSGIYVRTHSTMLVAELQVESQAKADALSEALGMTPKQLFLDIPHKQEADVKA